MCLQSLQNALKLRSLGSPARRRKQPHQPVGPQRRAAATIERARHPSRCYSRARSLPGPTHYEPQPPPDMQRDVARQEALATPLGPCRSGASRALTSPGPPRSAGGGGGGGTCNFVGVASREPQSSSEARPAERGGHRRWPDAMRCGEECGVDGRWRGTAHATRTERHRGCRPRTAHTASFKYPRVVRHAAQHSPGSWSGAA